MNTRPPAEQIWLNMGAIRRDVEGERSHKRRSLISIAAAPAALQVFLKGRETVAIEMRRRDLAPFVLPPKVWERMKI